MPNLLKIAGFEIDRLLLTRRGLLSLLTFMLVWLVIFRYAIWPASSLLRDSGNEGALGWLLELLDASSLTAWSVPELGVYWYFALWLLPFYTLVVTADQTASDRARGTLRFLHLRATRAEIFFGRFVGQVLILFLFILFTMLWTLAVAVYRDAASLAAGLEQCARMLPELMLVLLPFAALMSLMSILSKSARQAIMYAIVALIAARFAISLLTRFVPAATELNWLVPGSQLSQLRSIGVVDQSVVYLVPLLQTGVLLLLGWLVVRRINL